MKNPKKELDSYRPNWDLIKVVLGIQVLLLKLLLIVAQLGQFSHF